MRILLAILFLFSPLAFAQVALDEQSLDALYSESEAVQLSDMQLESLGLADSWVMGMGDRPSLRADGAVMYSYGRSQATIVCSVLQVCVIELEKGEILQDIIGGDETRWEITPTVFGEFRNEQTTLVTVSPTDINLNSSLYITTNKRGYHISLRSTANQYMPRIAFNYPQNRQRELALYREQLENMDANKPVVAETEAGQTRVLKIEDLDFGYVVEGEASWTPTRVYNDGVRTIIVLGSDVQQGVAPTLTVTDEKDNVSVVTHRYLNGRYSVDTVIEKAVLISGVGNAQEVVTIEKVGGEG